MKKLQFLIVLLTITLLAQLSLNQQLLAQNSPSKFTLFSSIDKQYESQNSDYILLADLLSELERFYDVTFLFEDQVLANIFVNISDIEIKQKTGNIGKELSKIFDRLGLSYQKVDKQTYVMLRKKPKLKEIYFDEEIVGQVTDATSGETLPGVNVIVKGTTTGTSTDSNGNFELNVSSRQDTLIFSFIGYQTKEIPINGRKEINVTLIRRAIEGEDVIVVGYGTVRKKDMTGSVSQVNSEDLTKVSVASPSELLVGRIPGLMTKQTTGLPGESETRLSVRGFEGDPLVLVDGIEIPFDYIDPNDIENISVLKDASAAIYGARAGNGVILVTTKKGTRGNPVINFRSNVSIQQPTVMYDPVNAGQWTELLREGEINLGLEPTYTNEEVQKYKNEEPGYESWNWYDEVFRNWAPMQEHNISVSGGGDEIRYYLSSGYLNQNSAYKSGDYAFERYNVRANVDANITDGLKASMDLSVRSENRDRAGSGQHDLFNALHRTQPIYSPYLPDGRPAFSGFGAESPLASSQKKYSGFTKEYGEFLQGTLALDYEIPEVENLLFAAQVAYSYHAIDRKNLNKPFEVYDYDEEADEYIFRSVNGTNSLQLSNGRRRWISPQISARYEKDLENHSFSGLLLAEWIDEENTGLSAFRRDLISSQVPYLFAGAISGISNDESMSQSGRASYVGRLKYGYRDKYRLETTLRADATHKFPKNNKWGFFPSISAAWTVSEEPFLDIDALDELRIRLSYSQSGNDNVGAFRYLSGYYIRGGQNYITGDQPSTLISEQQLANPNITWLDMTIYNIGLNTALWNGLISAEFNLFKRKTDNIFGSPQGDYPSTFGADLPQLNINATEDRGFDVMVKHENTIGDLNYSVSANVGYSREKYLDWSEPNYEDEDEIRIFQREGHYTNRIIGYVSDGIFMNQQEIDNYDVDQDGTGNSTLRPGDIKYVDLNGDGEITFRDQKEIGRGQFPDMTYGLNINLNYKDFSIMALFQGASMFNLNMTGTSRGPFANMTLPHKYQYKYRWQPDPENPNRNINPDAQLPAIDGSGVGTNENNDRTSDFWLQDGTYLRLKNLSLGYKLPANLTSNVGIKSATITISGSNLFMFNKLGIYKGSFDPEVPETTRGSYPPVRTFSIGMNVKI